MVEWLLWTSSASKIPSACSFGECQFRGFEGLAEQRCHFVPRGTTKGPPQETKDLEFAPRVKCLQHTWRKVPTKCLQKDALVPWWYWKATLKTCSVYWRDGFIPAISGVRANDFEQLMRETFRVRACERVDRGFLTTVEFVRRKVAWNAQDFFWIYDPTHTLADCSDVHYGE